MRATPRGNGSRCTHDSQNRHPRITPHGDFEFAHVPKQFADHLDFFVSPGQAQFDLFHGRPRFNNLKGYSARFISGFCLCQRSVTPGLFFRLCIRFGAQCYASNGTFDPALFHERPPLTGLWRRQNSNSQHDHSLSLLMFSPSSSLPIYADRMRHAIKNLSSIARSK